MGEAKNRLTRDEEEEGRPFLLRFISRRRRVKMPSRREEKFFAAQMDT